ncbi:MAG: hypothetical protein LC778_17095 [Acidobacteria bacterium]|nr:hypothetical protein [Acidobacteriota bacterium]
MRKLKKPLNLKIEYRSDERTLLEEEVEKINASILQNLESNIGAKQRF